jgi:DNA-binding NarL/FixJ family response regulator
LRELLDAAGGDIVVVGEAGTVEAALSRIPPVRPDVAVLDVRLPDGSGVEVCREIRSRHPEIQCLLLTSFADDEALLDAILAGAAGYVLKHIRGNDLVDSVRRVAGGQSLLDPSLTAAVLERLRRGPDEEAARVHLTERERRILDLLAEGLTNHQIGERLYLAEKTVKNYVSNLLTKLGMHRRTEDAVYAARLANRRDRPARGLTPPIPDSAEPASVRPDWAQGAWPARRQLDDRRLPKATSLLALSGDGVSARRADQVGRPASAATS